MYKTFVIDYHPQAVKMAASLEEKANAIAEDGFRVLSFSITNSGKAIILAQTKED
jgi:hypothetical protein